MTISPDDNDFKERRVSNSFIGSIAPSASPDAIATVSPSHHVHAALPAFELSDDQAASSVRNLTGILYRQRWKLTALIAIPMALVVVVTMRMTPLYESTVSMNVERRGNGSVGEQATMPSLGEMDQIMLTQIELIKSDPVLRPVAEKYKLLDAEGQFRWLNPVERARLTKSRVVLKRLKVARVPNTSILRISYRSPDPQLAADIVTMIARSYEDHAFDSRELANAAVSGVVNRQLADLKTKMVQSDDAIAAFARELGFVDPEQRASSLSARLLQLNTDYTAAQSDRLHKESLFNVTKSGNLAGAQVSGQGTLLDTAMTRLNQAKDEFAKVSTVFGEGHTEYQKAYREMTEVQRQFDYLRDNAVDRVAVDYRQALDREQMARDLFITTKLEVDGLTAKAFEYQRLKNDADNYRKLYDDLERITREQVINQSFREAILQVVDPARPSEKQASPVLALNLLVGFVLCTLFATGTVFVIDMMNRRVRSPEDAARLPYVEVIASMPKPGETLGVVAMMPRTRRSASLLQYQDSIRALRNSVTSISLDRPFRSLMVTSPRATDNASDIIANLAFSYSMVGQKVLLVDADFEQPSLHNYFEKSGGAGLAEVISGKATWKESLVRVGREEIFLMRAGDATESSSDLMSMKAESLLGDLSREFALVLILAPPVLDAADSISLAGAVDRVLVVARAHTSTADDVMATYTILRRGRADIIGMVVSDVNGRTKAVHAKRQGSLPRAA